MSIFAFNKFGAPNFLFTAKVAVAATKVKVLKVKFQNLGENGAEAHFTWEPRSGSFVPEVTVVEDEGPMPWEA